MVLSIRKLSFGVAGLALCASSAPAYQINPLKNKYASGRSIHTPLENKTEDVHEEITYAASRCAARRMAAGHALDGTPCAIPDEVVPLTARGNKYDALIRGVWWNDDPNQNLFSVHFATWLLWMGDAEEIALHRRNWLGRTVVLNDRYKMQYRSHYGDLQFLHGMANAKDDAASVVQGRLVDWMEFAYQVATGALEPDTPMSDVDLPLARNFFVKQPGWTVNHLFGPKYTLGKSTIPDVALGSMLHVIQDSFSKAHAKRAFDGSAACPSGRVLQFHAYGLQDGKRHRTADTRDAWRADQEHGFTADMNPVEASARIIRFARERADWSSVVRPYLEKTLFCVDGTAEPSGAGEYAPKTVALSR